MRSVSDVLQNHGGKAEFTTKDGKVVTINYLTLKHMSEYENRLQNNAIKKLNEQRSTFANDVFIEMFSRLMDNISAGHYAFGGEICSKSLNTVAGISDLISILCNVTPQEALEILMHDGEAFKAVFDEVVRKSVSSKDDEEKQEGVAGKND